MAGRPMAWWAGGGPGGVAQPARGRAWVGGRQWGGLCWQNQGGGGVCPPSKAFVGGLPNFQSCSQWRRRGAGISPHALPANLGVLSWAPPATGGFPEPPPEPAKPPPGPPFAVVWGRRAWGAVGAVVGSAECRLVTRSIFPELHPSPWCSPRPGWGHPLSQSRLRGRAGPPTAPPIPR